MTRKTLAGGRMVALVVGVLLLWPSGLVAQVVPPGGQRARELERRLEARFQDMIEERLQLGPEEARRLQGVMESFREKRMTLNRAQSSLRHQLRDPALPDLTEEEAREILRETIRLQEEELELYRREQEELLSILSPTQLVRFYSLREALGRRLRQLRERRGAGAVGGGAAPFR